MRLSRHRHGLVQPTVLAWRLPNAIDADFRVTDFEGAIASTADPQSSTRSGETATSLPSRGVNQVEQRHVRPCRNFRLMHPKFLAWRSVRYPQLGTADLTTRTKRREQPQGASLQLFHAAAAHRRDDAEGHGGF